MRKKTMAKKRYEKNEKGKKSKLTLTKEKTENEKPSERMVMMMKPNLKKT